MKHPYNLSTSNKVFIAIVAFFTIAINLVILNTNKYEYTNWEHEIGHAIGRLIGTLLFPFIFSLLTWFVLGRKENGGTTVFNIVLTIVLLGQLVQSITSVPL